MSTWNILYRGSLSSCNYDCDYCPFAKTSNTLSELQQDEAEVHRFLEWVTNQPTRISLLFTPWGEALVHRYYRRTLVKISHLPNISRVSIQTNLSAPIEDLLDCNRNTLALWTTFHPSQVTLDSFLSRCLELDRAQIPYSIGVVGLKEHLGMLEHLREAVPSNIYIWVNAYKRKPDYYSNIDLSRIHNVDPYFDLNRPEYPSAGQPCSAGETSFSVDGSGTIRRCHFLKDTLGNIYRDDIQTLLRPRACSAATCGCYIGYIHQPALRLTELYGNGLLARIPQSWPGINSTYSYRTARSVGEGH